MPGRLGNLGRSFGGMRGTAGKDSLKRRDKLEDSITISFRYLDSSRVYKLDSSVNDFTRRFPIPATHIYLGNDGSATRSILFSPALKAGWDPGFHAFDAYKWSPERVRFFNTTRPYTELNYLLGSRAEQIIEVLHTQNIKPDWNASFNYRLINSPGFFKNQQTNHNNYLFTSRYQAKSRRYTNYFYILANSLQASENGGILDDQDYLKNPIYKDRFNIPTHLGGDQAYGTNFFSTKITTGNRYRELHFLLRQQYDLGRKDSLVTDSTVIPLFYPRLRFEHTFQYTKYTYTFLDYHADSTYYGDFYHIVLTGFQDTVAIQDQWHEMVNDFSIYQFPDAKNLQQFVKLGAYWQDLRGQLFSGSQHFYNLVAHGEYRNRTRNQRWDIEAAGKLFLNGLNAGDYEAHLSLRRFTGRRLGYLELGFENVNRTPSFLFDNRSNFHLDTLQSFNKENTSHIYASVENPALRLRLAGDYYLLSNYTYLTDYFRLHQENALFNLLRISLQKTFRIGRHWNWYTDIYVQQKTGNVQLSVPLVFTRNRLAYEGVFYKNLNISTGVEVRYHSPYHADGYSPLLGQFFYQDSLQIANRPDVSLFLNFRIRSFKAFVSLSNLNAVNVSGGFGFTRNNLAAPDYPYPGMQFRLGIYWSFVN
ncbi:MAG TPA: putative porin [Chitinophagaceae bacterium]|nr:putative porin [Chitinophagaceae bacterium]